VDWPTGRIGGSEGLWSSGNYSLSASGVGRGVGKKGMGEFDAQGGKQEKSRRKCLVYSNKGGGVGLGGVVGGGGLGLGGGGGGAERLNDRRVEHADLHCMRH